MKKSLVAAVVAGSFVVGGAAAMVVFQPAGAQTSPSTTVAPATGSAPGASGTFTPNEDPAHEATESPEREAQEDSGQAFAHGGPGGRHGSNEDPAHEATESPEREAQEDSGQAPSGQAPADSSSTTTSPSTPAA